MIAGIAEAEHGPHAQREGVRGRHQPRHQDSGTQLQINQNWSMGYHRFFIRFLNPVCGLGLFF